MIKIGKLVYTTVGMMALIVVLIPFHSELNDGLERVAADHGFEDRGESRFAAPFADYEAFGSGKMLACIIGMMLVILVIYVIGRLLVQ